MIEIITNEKSWVKDMIESRSLGARPYDTLVRAAKLYYAEGHKKRDIPNMLERLILSCDKYANINAWQSTIDMAVRSIGRPLREVDGIPITVREIETVKTANGVIRQRLLFTMLVVAKYGNMCYEKNNNWVNREQCDIFTLANIKASPKRRSLYVNDLWSAGYIGYSNIVDNTNIVVNIMDGEDGETAFVVEDFRNLGNQYMKYCGERYVECERCGVVIKAGSNRQTYCQDCARDVIRERRMKRGEYDTFSVKAHN